MLPKDDDSKKWELKQVGTGIGGSILVMFMMQDRGIDFMSKQQMAENNVVVEKTIANAGRIQKLETNVQNLNDKIDRGFDSVRDQIRNDFSKLSDIVRVGAIDRFTKTEHIAYKESMELRIQRLEEKILQMKFNK